MKKWITGLLIVLMVFFSAVYLIIPGNLVVSVTSSLKCPEAASVRLLSDTAHWKKWWPKKENADSLSYNGYQYRLSKVMYNAYDVLQINNGDTINSQIVLFRYSADSLIIKWRCLVKTGKNPFVKISRYFEAKKMEQNIADLIKSLNNFALKSENIYGFDINLITIKDTTIISKKILEQAYPSTEAIYAIVSDLKAYIASQGAKETNYPMLNVRHTDSGYLTLVAIPADRVLKGTEKLIAKRLPIIKDNTILIEVHGGVLTVKKAFAQLALYMQDHHYGSPALPFESLVTDRRKETDTTKWITKIYAPIQ